MPSLQPVFTFDPVSPRCQELRSARSRAEEDRRREAELETQLERLQQQVRQAQLDRSALEESFSKERALLTSRVTSVRRADFTDCGQHSRRADITDCGNTRDAPTLQTAVNTRWSLIMMLV